MKLAIIGAGVAGLAAAHRLRRLQPATDISVYEKSRGVGGRVATRRFNGATFDHGAQYIKAPTPALQQLLTQELGHASLDRIALPVWTFDAKGTVLPGDPELNLDPKWTYAEGNSQLAKELASGLTIHFEQAITHLTPTNSGWALHTAAGLLAEADAVLLTPPAPQTAELLAASQLPEAHTVVAAELSKVTYRQCLTVTLGYPRQPRPRPYYALVNPDKQHPITWLAFEHLKPGRKMAGQGVYILQMSPTWSATHWDQKPDVLATSVAHLLTDLINQPLRSPLWSNRQGWRYALPDGQADFATINQAIPGLFFAGDWTAGQGRVHLAIEQGWAVADLIAQQAG